MSVKTASPSFPRVLLLSLHLESRMWRARMLVTEAEEGSPSGAEPCAGLALPLNTRDGLVKL